MVDMRGRTALLVACAKGNSDIVRELLNHGANLLATDDQQKNCLMLAAEAGNKETVLVSLICFIRPANT